MIAAEWLLRGGREGRCEMSDQAGSAHLPPRFDLRPARPCERHTLLNTDRPDIDFHMGPLMQDVWKKQILTFALAAHTISPVPPRTEQPARQKVELEEVRRQRAPTLPVNRSVILSASEKSSATSIPIACFAG